MAHELSELLRYWFSRAGGPVPEIVRKASHRACSLGFRVQGFYTLNAEPLDPLFCGSPSNHSDHAVV